MSQTASSTARNWNDPDVCPFCEAQLPDPGAGFIDHLESSPGCESGFEAWRENVTQDMDGGWSG